MYQLLKHNALAFKQWLQGRVTR